MDNTVVAAVVGAIAGVIGGFIGSVVAPWVNWHIEVWRQQRSAHQDVIAYARGLINSTEFSVDQFRKETIFHQLGLHSPQMVAAVQAEQVPGHSASARREQIRELLLKEVARIERKWGLV